MEKCNRGFKKLKGREELLPGQALLVNVTALKRNYDGKLTQIERRDGTPNGIVPMRNREHRLWRATWAAYGCVWGDRSAAVVRLWGRKCYRAVICNTDAARLELPRDRDSSGSPTTFGPRAIQPDTLAKQSACHMALTAYYGFVLDIALVTHVTS